LAQSIDSSWNGVFGLALSIWAAVFVDNWSKKEEKLQHKWDLLANKDEYESAERIRKGKFSYMMEYNSVVNTKLKVSVGNPLLIKLLNYTYNVVMVFILVAVMFYFEDKKPVS
jgi:hypothetical protein